MINNIGAYAEAGCKAGLARKHGDEANASFHSKWARRAIQRETDADKIAARKAFNDAYSAEATPAQAGAA